MALRKDGVLELVVITSSRLDGSPETQTLLLDKIELYLSFLRSEECRSEFGELSQAQKLIVLCCYEKPGDVSRFSLASRRGFRTALRYCALLSRL